MKHCALEETCNPGRGKLTNEWGVREVPRGILGLGWGMEETTPGILEEDFGEEGRVSGTRSGFWSYPDVKQRCSNPWGWHDQICASSKWWRNHSGGCSGRGQGSVALVSPSHREDEAATSCGSVTSCWGLGRMRAVCGGGINSEE